MDNVQKRGTRHTVDILFVLLLFCVLAVCSLSVVIIGADVYRDAVDRMDENFSVGTSLSYLTNKIRQNDAGGAVYLSEVEGTPALVLERIYNQQEYATYIFHHDGYLKEVMVRADAQVRLLDGAQIIQVSRFSIQEEDGLLRLTVQEQDGRETTALVGLRSEGVAGSGDLVEIP